MALASRRRCSSQLLRHTDVPARVTESFILSGYRSPDYSLGECLASAFRPTNETANFWTHFLALFVFAFHFLELFWWERTPPCSDPFFYPFWNYFIGVAGLLVVSSMAHLLNSMSLLVREVCFFVDYGTISAYTVGSSLAYFYYIHPKAGIVAASGLGQGRNGSGAGRDVGNANPLPLPLLPPSQTPPSALPDLSFFFETVYIPSACLVALICTLACCNTRQRWRRYRYVIRTLVFLLPFTVASAPVFYRLYTAPPVAGGPGWACGGPPGPEVDVDPTAATLAPFFYRHCFWLALSAVFNISKIPERLSPGRFDIWGHSHQWFHCCTFLSILDELHMIKAEIRDIAMTSALGLDPQGDQHGQAGLSYLSPSSPSSSRPLAGPTLLSTYGVMFGLQTCIAAIISWFVFRTCADHGFRPPPPAPADCCPPIAHPKSN